MCLPQISASPHRSQLNCWHDAVHFTQIPIDSVYLSLGDLNKDQIYVFRNTFNDQKDIPFDATLTLFSTIYQLNIMNGHTSFIPSNFGKYENCKDVYDTLQYIYNNHDKSYMYDIDKRNIIYIKIIDLNF